MTAGPAADRWRTQLAAWAIPDHILAAAPADPHALSVRQFTARATEARQRALTVTHRRACERLPDGGSVLDVGCGGGAGSLPLAGRAGLLIGADESSGMLAAFADAARQLDVDVDTVEGAWPDAARRAPAADVVVCLHVVYNVADLAPFASQLHAHARTRVVLEFPTRHPTEWLRPYWEAVHGVDRPHGPTHADALEVLAELGLTPRHERWSRPNSLARADRHDQISHVSQRLAVGDDRRAQITDLVARFGVPAARDVVTAWWDVD